MKWKAATELRTSSLLLIALLLGPASQAYAVGPVAQAKAEMPTVLITGSNRGIGLEFARQYASKGWKVLATTRRPETADQLEALSRRYPNVVIERLDVTDNTGIRALSDKYRDDPIDLLINNAGVLGAPEQQSLEVLDYETFTQVMAINVYGPLQVAQAFLDQVAKSRQKKMVAITSGVASMELTGERGDLYFYRISKAALNMAMRTLQAEVRDLGITVALITPGEVQTRMLGLARPGRQGMSPEKSVSGMIAVIEDLTLEKGGSFLSYQGETVPW